MLNNFLNKVFFFNDARVNHVKSLDGLRGIAVILVLLSHSSNSGIFFHEYLNFEGVGKLGVYLFFILSAYLLDKQIIEKFIEGKADKKYWINYIFRRFLRIYPLYVIVLVVYYLLYNIGFNTQIESLRDLLYHVLLLKGESVFWSIAVEFKYYLISPLIIFICHKYLRWKPILLVLFLSGLVLTSIKLSIETNLSELSTLKYLSIFLMGTILSIITVHYKERFYDLGKGIVFDVLAIISFILIIYFFPYYHSLLFNTEINAESTKFMLPVGLLWSTILTTIIFKSKSFITNILEDKILRFFGVISYSAYLLHMLVLAVVNKAFVTTPQSLKIYLFFIITIFISSISYYLIEKPLSKIRINGLISSVRRK